MVISNLSYLEVMSGEKTIEGGSHHWGKRWKKYYPKDFGFTFQNQVAVQNSVNIAVGVGAVAASNQEITQVQQD